MTIDDFKKLPIDVQLELINDYGSECYGAGSSDAASFDWGLLLGTTKETFEEFLKSAVIDN